MDQNEIQLQLNMLKSQDSSLKLAAVNNLAKINDKSLAKHFLELLKDKSSATRQIASQWIIKFADKDIISDLAMLLN
ncbi:hypothetical protein ACFLQQ_01515 [Actinomycetota bacterium]